MVDPLLDVPIVCPTMQVENAWIDHNGHMNMAYYLLIFDRCLDFVYDHLNIGVAYVEASGGSCFSREVQVNYLQEVVAGDPVRVTFQLMDCDEKRLHFFQHMYHDVDDYLAATSEQLALHVDMNQRRTTPLPKTVQQQLNELVRSHKTLPRPLQAGGQIGIRRSR